MGKHVWVNDEEQKVWVWISILFAIFYFGEAFLFWGPTPRIHSSLLQLTYWGIFGLSIYVVGNRRKTSDRTKLVTRTHGAFQWSILGAGITMSVVGITFLVMRLTGNVTLGHMILLATMCEAAIVICGMSGNMGWLAASLVWAASAVLVYRYPPVQDIIVGVAFVVGFALVGLIRKSLCEYATTITVEQPLSPGVDNH